ncbi:MAG: iron ABC transporter permease [Tissierellaceae bacterium]
MKIDIPIFNVVDRLLMVITILATLVFILWPVASVIGRSLIFEGGLSFKEYSDLFRQNIRLLINSLKVSSLTTVITMFFSISIALYERYSTNKIKKIILPLLFLTMISPPFVSSLAYINLFGRRGFITYRILKLAINPYGWHGVVLMQSLGEISLISILMIGVIEGIDKNLINASRDLGSDSTEAIRRVVLPLAKSGILAALFITFVKSLADFGTPIIIGGNFKTLATESYLTVIGRSNLSRASAMSVLILIPSLIIFSFYKYHMEELQVLNKPGSKAFESGEAGLKLTKKLNILFGIISWFFIAVMLLQYITIFISAITYFNGEKYIFTLKHIASMKGGLWKSFFRSIRYSFIAAISTGILGLLLAYYIERRKFKGSRIVDYIATLPYILPGTFFGIGYILAFNKRPLKLTGTVAIVLLNYIFRQIPIATKAGSAALLNLSEEIENAAKDLGVERIFIMKDIVFPLLRPAFLIIFINTFTTTMTSVGSIIFIISPGAKVATVEMFNALRDGYYGTGAVIANLIVFSTLIINMLFSKIILGKANSQGDKYVSAT